MPHFSVGDKTEDSRAKLFSFEEERYEVRYTFKQLHELQNMSLKKNVIHLEAKCLLNYKKYIKKKR